MGQQLKTSQATLLKFSIPVGLLLFCFVFLYFRYPLILRMRDFQLQAEQFQIKADAIRQKYTSHSPHETLLKLPVNEKNGQYYRFDEHLGEVRFTPEQPSGTPPTIVQSDVGFSFNEQRPTAFNFTGPHFSIHQGVLQLTTREEEYLVSEGDLALGWQKIGEIEFRIKVRGAENTPQSGREARFVWSKHTLAELKAMTHITITDPASVPSKMIHRNKMAWIKVSIKADDTFNLYRVNIQSAFTHHFNYGDKLRTFLFLPSNIPGDQVEIDFIRFVPKREKYSQAPYGQTYEVIDGEMRAVTYCNTPSELDYSVTIPTNSPRLKFGLGILENDDPVRFSVSISANTGHQEIFTEVVETNQNWRSFGLDLSAWANQKVSVIFRTDSEHNVAFWSNPLLFGSPPENFNVIVILEDALRADHLSTYGYHRLTSPIKDQCAQDGVVFEYAFSQATKTRPSCPSLMTSMYPTATGVWSPSDVLDNRYLTLAEIMRSQGFETVSFIQNGNAGPVVGLHQGFSQLFDNKIMKAKPQNIYGDLVFQWLQEHQAQNFFMYLHLIDPHGIYDPPPPFDTWYQEEGPGKTEVAVNHLRHDPAWMQKPTVEGRRLLYDGEIRHNDFHLEKFLAKLKSLNLLHNTLLIFVSDHGEHLGEHGFWEHCPPAYIQVLRTQLIMVYPKLFPRGLHVNQPVQLLDIMPTILDVAGITTRDLSLQGDSLVTLVQDQRPDYWQKRFIFCDEVMSYAGGRNKEDPEIWASVFFRDWHILRSREVPDMHVFNYVDDQQENNPLSCFMLDIFLKTYVTSFMRSIKESNMRVWRSIATDIESQVIHHDPEVTEHLKSLGYIN
ncbi:sulfatase [candidate division CSSED10-310 bacterium]|uniref:Sulfatase n=1 Tax=candidate division CSSED10-310 bacterium TaxID=2855610 RepID=A0ABV6YWM3_UNCC1